jgi:aminoglycoside 6'-N-acetyltransferase
MAGSVSSSYPVRLRINDRLWLRLSTSSDVDRLLAWTQDPKVYKWWQGRPLTRGKVGEKYTGKRLPYVIAYIIEQDKNPVGLIQAWQEKGACGLDMFVAAAAEGQGIGSTAARVLARDVSARGWRNITADPALDNERSIRAWAKAGFVPTGGRGQDSGRPTRTTQIMVYQTSS